MTVGWKQPCDAVCACPPWFVQNIIASDCLCFYWIRLALLTPTAINKQAMAALAETVKLLSQFQRRFVLCTHTVWCIYSILGMDFSICVIHGNDAPHYEIAFDHYWFSLIIQSSKPKWNVDWGVSSCVVRRLLNLCNIKENQLSGGHV